MAVGIECPICETVFLVKRVGPKIAIRCPDCQRRFRYSEAVLADPADPLAPGDDLRKPTKSIGPPKPHARTEPSSNTKPTPADKPPSVDARPSKLATLAPAKSNPVVPIGDHHLSGIGPSSADTPPTSNNQSSAVSDIRAIYNQRNRRQKLTSIILAVAGVAAICVLSVILFRQLTTHDTKQPASLGSPNSQQSDLGRGDRPATAPAVSGSSDAPNRTQPSIAAVESVAPRAGSAPPRFNAENLPEREFDYFSKRELELIWERVRPRLLSLSIRTDQGNLPAVGTIIDSRGWAMTSYQLVGKWPEVAVTASAANIDSHREHLEAISGKKTDSQKLLTDQSKGLAGQNPKVDLALLAVNLRFVVALDKFEILPRTKIVAGMYLAQAGPPSIDNPYGVEEIEVFAKQNHDELENAARNKADALGLTAPTIDWIVTEKKARPAPGTPALDRSGGLLARYVFSTRHYAYFLPADDALSAVRLASDSGTGKTTRPNAPETNLLPVDHSMARPNELMNRAGQACEQFDWLPTNPEEYLQLQKFSRRISTIQKFIRENQEKESESNTLSILSNHFTRWQKSLSRSLRNPKILSDDGVDELNQFALKQLGRRSLTTGSSYIPFFAEVYSAGIDENNLDSILLKIGDRDAFVRVPFDERSGLRPGSRWLCFFKRDTRLVKRNLKLDSDESAPLFTGKLSLVIGPFKR